MNNLRNSLKTTSRKKERVPIWCKVREFQKQKNSSRQNNHLSNSSDAFIQCLFLLPKSEHFQSICDGFPTKFPVKIDRQHSANRNHIEVIEVFHHWHQMYFRRRKNGQKCEMLQPKSICFTRIRKRMLFPTSDKLN